MNMTSERCQVRCREDQTCQLGFQWDERTESCDLYDPIHLVNTVCNHMGYRWTRYIRVSCNTTTTLPMKRTTQPLIIGNMTDDST